MLVAPHMFSKILAACNIKRYCCNTAGNSNRFDLAAVFQPTSYVFATRFSMISLRSIFRKTFASTKMNVMITFQEDLKLFEESLLF